METRSGVNRATAIFNNNKRKIDVFSDSTTILTVVQSEHVCEHGVKCSKVDIKQFCMD